MSDNPPNILDQSRVAVPIIEAHKDQQLIVNFIKNEQGQDSISFAFEPDFNTPTTPAQRAAVAVANHIIKSFGLNADQPQETENGKKSSIILPN